jgi:hypothetical protein
MRIIGAAEGAIMPTIITAHMVKTNANSMGLHGAFAGAMTQRFGCLRGRLNVDDSGRVKRCCGRHDDRQRHQVGKCHADEGIQPDALHCIRALARRPDKRLAFGMDSGVFGFLRRLPEEQIWTNGGAQHGHDHGPKPSLR